MDMNNYWIKKILGVTHAAKDSVRRIHTFKAMKGDIIIGYYRAYTKHEVEDYLERADVHYDSVTIIPVIDVHDVVI